MPAYNFMKMRKPKILDGSKAQTIRRRRKHPTKPGQTLSLYTGMRTKSCELIGRVPCAWVKPVVIYPKAMLIKVNGSVLSIKNTAKLALADGFSDIPSFFKFFERYERECLDDFEIVGWDPALLEVNCE